VYCGVFFFGVVGPKNGTRWPKYFFSGFRQIQNVKQRIHIQVPQKRDFSAVADSKAAIKYTSVILCTSTKCSIWLKSTLMTSMSRINVVIKLRMSEAITLSVP
jgi:hypothetical protein